MQTLLRALPCLLAVRWGSSAGALEGGCSLRCPLLKILPLGHPLAWGLGCWGAAWGLRSPRLRLARIQDLGLRIVTLQCSGDDTCI